MKTVVSNLTVSAALITLLLAPALAQSATPIPTVSVIVGFKDLQGSEAHRIIHSYGGQVRLDISYVSAVAANLSPMAMQALANDPMVDYVELDHPRYLTSHVVNLQLWTGSPEVVPWGVEKINANDVWDKNGDLTVDRKSVAGQGVKVAVLDTGVDLNHPDLKANLVPLSEYCAPPDICDFVENDSDPSDSVPGPFQGHGTLTSGNIAAVDNNIGVIGVAPKARILMYRVCESVAGACSSSAITAAIGEAVSDGARVISMSFGGDDISEAEKDAITAAYRADVVLVASSGNGGAEPVLFPARLPEVIAVGATDRNDVIADFSSFGPDQELVAPGVEVPSTTVQGTGREALLSVVSGFSPTGGRQTNPMQFSALGSVQNRQIRYVGIGTPADVAAECGANPCTGQIALIQRGVITFGAKVANAAAAGFAGAVIYNNVPGNFLGTLLAPSTIPAASLSLEDGDPIRAAIQAGNTVFGSLEVVASDYEAASGTSFSAPHVSGVAALIRSKNTRLSNVQVRSILTSTAVDLGPPGYDEVYGFGRVDAAAAINATPRR